MRSLLTRDDIFISYSRRDAGAYAAGLADKLTEKRFSCFLDRLGTEPNEQLPASLRAKIRNCSLFVVVGSAGGAASTFVEQEIAEFRQTKRVIVPIDFDGAVATARWYPLIVGIASEPEGTPGALASGEPSVNVLSRIEKSFNYARRNERMQRFLWGALSIFAVLALGALAAAYWARSNLLEANRQQQLAAQNQSIARERLVDLSQEQGRLELLRGNGQQAFVYLSDAYAQRPQDEALRFLVAMARRSLVMTLAPARETHNSRMAPGLDLGFGYNLYSMASSADGAQLVTASLDSVSVWSLANGTPIRSFGPRLETDSVANGAGFATFIDGGRQVLSRERRTVKIWNVDSGELARTLPQLAAEADMVGTNGEDPQLSFDEKRLLVPRDAAEVYELASGRLLFKLASPNLEAAPSGISGNSVAISRDGSRIATTSKGFTIDLWDGASGRLVRSLAKHPDGIAPAAFSPDGKLVVTADSADPGSIRIWDAASGEPRHQLKGDSAVLRAAAFSPDGRLLATAKGNKMLVEVWDVGHDFALLHRFEHQCESASRQMARVLAFSPNGRTLAVVCKPEFADVWNTETGERIERVADSVNAAMITPDGEWLVVSNVQDAVKVRSARRNLLIDSLYDADSPESSIVSAALDADGRYIAAVAANGTLRVWSLSGRRLLRTFEVHQVAPVFESWSNPDGLPSGIALSAQSFNGDARLVIPTADTGAQIWDVQQNKLLQKLGAKGHVNAASFSPDGRYVVTTVADGDTESAEVWDARTGQLSLTLRDERPLRAGLFSPDGKFVLTLHGSSGGFLWDAATGEQLRKTYGDQPSFSHDGKLLLHTYATPLFGSGGGVRHGAVLERTQSGELVHQLEHKQAVYSAAFSPDGSRIVTASWDGVARMWDASSGKLLQSFGGHDGPVRCAAFSPAGGRLVTCGEDRLVKVWDVARGQLLQTLSGHVAPVQFAGFSPHGNMLLSLSSPPESSGSVLRLWDVRLETQPPREVAALVERWVPAPVLSTVVRQTFP